jgi:DNA-binding NarL/FixJ family response regulator
MTETFNFNPVKPCALVSGTVEQARISRHQALTILVAEDEKAFQVHVRAALELVLDMPLKFLTALTGTEVIEIALSSNPSLVIMDTTLPVLDGLSAARRLWSQRPAIKILFWAQQFREIYARELQAIVPNQATYGFMLKSSSDEDLAYAVSSIVLHDNSYIDASVRAALRQSQKSISLSNVELETLHQLALGLTDKAMAMRSEISLRGVQNRINALYRKLLLSENQILQKHRAAEMVNLRSRLTFEAIRRGLIDPASMSELDQECSDWIVNTLGGPAS